MTQTIAQLLASQNRLSVNRPLSLHAYNSCVLAACKESPVRAPGASGFCYLASDFCS